MKRLAVLLGPPGGAGQIGSFFIFLGSGLSWIGGEFSCVHEERVCGYKL